MSSVDDGGSRYSDGFGCSHGFGYWHFGVCREAESVVVEIVSDGVY